MKSLTRYFQGLMLGALLITTISCEDFALGEKFLQKPPSSDVTIDTIFSTAVYARRVLWNSYGNLPYAFWASNSYGYSTNMWFGIQEDLTDLCNSALTWDGPNKAYYSGAYNAGSEEASDGDGGTKYGFTRRNSWKSIRMAWVFIENVDRVPDMEDAEKLRLKAEAKIVIATQYAEMLRHFGGLPIVDRAISAEDGLGFPARATLQETVNFIVRLLDEAIDCKELPWNVTEEESDNWSGRLTRASAMGLKVRVLLFAASPLFNNEMPYYEGEASEKLMTWFGGYEQKRWEDAEGNIFAKRVGTMVVYYYNTGDWHNNATYEIHYGDITGSPVYKPHMMRLQVDERYSLNSKGESVPVREVAWADEDETPTHMILQFTASHGGAYIGSPGNTLWVDNVKLVYAQ